VNIPMVPQLLEEGSLKVYKTHMWRNSYSRLFKAIPAAGSSDTTSGVAAGGPDSPQTDLSKPEAATPPKQSNGLVFKFSPDMKDLITPPLSAIPQGSDGWAMHQQYGSVTALRACFAEPPMAEVTDVEERVWKMKL